MEINTTPAYKRYPHRGLSVLQGDQLYPTVGKQEQCAEVTIEAGGKVPDGYYGHTRSRLQEYIVVPAGL